MVPTDNLDSTSATSSTTSKQATEANPNCAETFASLRFFGDGLVPEQISDLLGLEPTEAALKGLATTSPSGKTRVASTGRWLLETRGQANSTDLEAHLVWLLDRLEATRAEPTSLPGVSQADVFCYWLSATGNGGPSLSPQVLSRLAHLQLRLNFDLYGPV